MSAPSVHPWAIVELRRYTLHPGRRGDLVTLFDTEFVHTQEAVGIDVIGQFTDDDHADTFTWFRGFPDMAARRDSLGAFYGGPCWAQFRHAANATMIDSDDVLLLSPVPGHELTARTGAHGAGFDVVTFHLDAAASPETVGALCGHVDPSDAVLVTLDAVNDFPALPVREGEHVMVVVARPRPTGSWAQLGSALAPVVRRAEILRLRPTAGSRLR